MPRIPVLLSLPTQPELIRSARNFLNRTPTERALAGVTIPNNNVGLELDTEFAAVPIGSGTRDETVKGLIPEESRRFLVRATIDVESMSRVPVTIGDDPEITQNAIVFADPVIRRFIADPVCLDTEARGTWTDVRTALNHAALVEKGLDGSNVAIAILDSGIDEPFLTRAFGRAPIDARNSWTKPGTITAPGTWPADHGTTSAFNALTMAPKASLLDYAIFTEALPDEPTLSATVAAAVQAVALIADSWSDHAKRGLWEYNGLVVSNSWGQYDKSDDFDVGHIGRYCDNPGHPFHLQIGLLAAAGADIVFAAGNCGAACPHEDCASTTRSIMGCNAHAKVLSVAGCDIDKIRVGYSSQGPSILRMPQKKPDITGYTHFRGSEVRGAGIPDVGTSVACPVVAGCIAAIRTKLSPATMAPSALFAKLKKHAEAGPGTVAGKWNRSYGYGIIDPLATATKLGL